MTAEEACAALAALGRHPVRAPRLLIVLAHPDDETIALGGRMEWLADSRFLCVTNGAPLDGTCQQRGFASPAEYAQARQHELAQVLRHAHLPSDWVVPLTPGGHRISDKQARCSLVALTRALVQLIAQHQPDAVLTHPYEGGHPDHDACAFAVYSAMRLGRQAIPILEAPFYHRGDDGFQTGEFAAGDPGVEAALLPAQSRNKQARFACFRSQAQTLARFNLRAERYRTAPRYDFSRPPHPGTLNYEYLGWGMTGAEFCTLTSEAQRALALPSHPPNATAATRRTSSLSHMQPSSRQ